ncbi:MAG TPA: LptA/OstA family protein [Magnetospirillaceae bacterium]|nr:LptA/OstA family protein [Magnetospirillaceae bacterium]
MKKAALCLIAAGLVASPLVLAKDAKEAKPAPAAASTSDDIGLGRSNQPLDVTADQGIEFSKDAKEIIARVNAKAVRGNTTVTGDTLTAYYRDKKPAEATAPAKAKTDDKPKDDSSTGGSEVWRVVADGTVEIFTPTQHAYGDHADYNVDDAVVVMTGDHLKMTTPQDIVTARDTLEYWENKHQAVARGDAVALSNQGKRIQADTLVADFAENKQKQMVIQVAHGYDHVVLTTPTDVVTGDRADYVVETGIVTVTGSVKMNHNGNQADGAYAVVNLNTGISKLFSALPGGRAADRQVKALLVPAPKKAATPAPAPQNPPKVP